MQTARTLTVFETTDVQWCPLVTGVKNCQSFAGPKSAILGFGCCAYTQHTSQKPQLWAAGVISRAYQRPKDVPYVREF